MKKLSTYLRLAVLDAITYRGDVLLFVLGGISQPLVFLAVWIGIGYSGGNFLLSTTELVQYYLLVMFISYLNSTWASPFITRDIRLGRLSPFLLKPAPYLYFQIGNNLGEKLIKGLYLLPIIAALGIIFRVPFPAINYQNTLAFTISLFLAITTAFMLDICVGIAGFWFEDTEALDDLYGLGYTLLSGSMIPLLALPEKFQSLVNILPFRYLLSLPIEIIQGKLGGVEAFASVGIQLLWLLIAISIYSLLWRRGLRRYSAVGA